MRGIYSIRNKVTGKYYIGETVNLRKREIQHYSNLRNNRHENNYLQKSFNKYGESAFEFIILRKDRKLTHEQLYELEKYYIDFYDSYHNGYNLTEGGQGTKGREFSEEERLYRSKKMTGKGNHFYGKKHSEETKKRLAAISSTKTGEKNPFYGKTHAADWKEKRQALYEQKKVEGWICPNKGKPKPKEAVETMKKNMPNRCEIIVDGIEYMSISNCSKCIGLSRATIRKRIKDDKFPNYQYKSIERINA
jgi:group I intron endonuclease